MLLKNKLFNAGPILLLFLTLLVNIEKTNSFSEPPPTTKAIIGKVLNSIDNVKTLKYNLKLSERVNGKILHTESSVKLQTHPRKLYLYLHGPELLWIEGTNNGNAIVNPGAFPYFNLNLSPNGSIMRKDQHHTIHEMGFDYFASILRNVEKKVGDKFDKYFLYIGEEKWNNRSCYKVIISYPEFAFVPYKVLKGENIITIARKLGVGEYMILENNPDIKDYYGVKEGATIKVPNAYAKLTTMLIDKHLNLPINNIIFDDKGMFEAYEYYNLQVNTTIEDIEFTKAFKDYHF